MRLYHAILRHLILTMAALAVCAVVASAMRAKTATLPPDPISPDDPPPQDPGLIALTVAEVKRLFNLLTRTVRETTHHLHWTWWRQRHQARARWYHRRTRLRRLATHMINLSAAALLGALRLQSDSYSREGALRRALLATTYARHGIQTRRARWVTRPLTSSPTTWAQYV